MKRLVLEGLVVLLLSSLFVLRATISVAEASPDVYPGDLVIDGNNVTVIEGRFDINGSIVVMGNATLVLRNAFLNFTQIVDHQFNVSFRNAAQGNPRLIVENATVSSSTYAIDWVLYENSTASIDRLEMPPKSILIPVSDANVSVKDSSFDSLWANDHSVATVVDSFATIGVNGYDSSRVSINNCTLGHVYSLSDSNVTVMNTRLTDTDYSAYAYSYSVNSSIFGLKPQHIEYWNLKANCSIVVGLNGEAPNFTLLNTDVGSWGFSFGGSSNVTVADSNLGYFRLSDSAVGSLNYSLINVVLFTYDNSKAYLFESNVTWGTVCSQNSSVWLYMSSIPIPEIYGQAMVFDCWFLEVHVKDGVDNIVPDANVTAINQVTGKTQIEVTNENGITKLLLAENMKNATGNFSVSEYTIQATYEAYSNNTSVNITGDQEITITISDLVIPEFSSLPAMLFIINVGILMVTFAAKRKRIRRG